MKKILILCCLCYQVSFAQQTHFFTLLGQTSKKPIAYAAIWVKNKKYGAYANEKGEFALDLTQNDTLEISSVGYENLQFIFKEDDKKQQEILLKEKINELPIVTITPNPKKEEQVGFFNVHKKKKEIQFSRWLPAMEVAVFIPNSEPLKVKYIKSINLNVLKGSFHKGIYKVHLYSNTLENCPDKKLLPKEIVFTGEEVSKNKTISIDILAYNLVFPKEGIFISVECMGFIDAKTGLIISDRKLTGLSETPIFKNSTSIGFLKIQGNETYERWGNSNSWIISDWWGANRNMLNYGLKPAFGLTLVEADD